MFMKKKALEFIMSAIFDEAPIHRKKLKKMVVAEYREGLTPYNVRQAFYKAFVKEINMLLRRRRNHFFEKVETYLKIAQNKISKIETKEKVEEKIQHINPPSSPIICIHKDIFYLMDDDGNSVLSRCTVCSRIKKWGTEEWAYHISSRQKSLHSPIPKPDIELFSF